MTDPADPANAANPVHPAEAAQALAEIDHRREQVIRRKVFPRWYWWAHASLIVVLATALQSGDGRVMGLGVAVFVAGASAVDLPVSRAARAAAPHRRLAGPGGARRTLIGLVSFVAVLLALMITTAQGLEAAGAPYPVTIAAAVTGVAFAVGGQLLVRLEAAATLRRTGGPR